MKNRIMLIISITQLLCAILLVVVVSLKYNEAKKEPVPKEPTDDIVEKVLKKIDNSDKRFLSWIDNNYKGALKDLDKRLETEEYDAKIWHDVTGYSYNVLIDLYHKNYDNMDNVKIQDYHNPGTLSFVGDISLADNWQVMPKYDERGQGVKGILSADILDIMTKSDVMVANSEFTVSNRGVAMSGKRYTFRASPERLNIYHEMGVDLVTLANNHTYDYGKTAFLDMLDAFKEYQIPSVGAGHNLDEAQKPYYFIVNGYKIAFLNATRAEKNILTPGAIDNSEGVFRCYDPTNMINQIKSVKENSDYVIAIIHFGKEDSHELEKEQIDSSRAYIDAGADVIVGHHAHTLQGIEFYNHKPIIYNLGDFIFNAKTEDTAIFQMNLNSNGSLDYYILPALQKDVYTDLLKDNDKKRVINDLNAWSINATILEDGKIIEKT